MVDHDSRRDALLIAASYAVFGVVWILGTDLLVAGLAVGEAEARWLQTLKGWLFVLLSTGFLFVLVRRGSREYGATIREARDRGHRFRALVENARDMIFWVASPDFDEIDYLSPSFEEIWGRPRSEPYEDPASLLDSVHPEDRERMHEGRLRARRGGYTGQEYRVVRPDGEIRWMRSQGYPIPTREGEVERVAGVTEDVTGRRRAFDELRRSRRLSRRAERIGRLGHWELDLATADLTWSEEVYRIFGVDPDEFEPTRESFLERVHPDDREAQRAADDATRAGEGPLDFEHRIVRPDGEVRVVHERATLLEGESEEGQLVGTVQDVTERKQLERELERSRDLLRAYAGRLTSERERERADLAREIHDHLGQILTAVKLQLDREVREGGEGRSDRLRETVELVEEGIDEVREISSQLRPAYVDQLGLVDGLAAYADQFEERSGVATSFETDLDRLDLDEEAAIHLFRVAQEALTNVARHAGADRAGVRLHREGDALVLRVLDDGGGLRKASVEGGDSHGLTGMRERARLLDGDFELGDRSGGGAEVRVRIPWPGGEGA